MVVQLVVGKGLEGDTAAAVVLPHQDRQTAEPVPGGDDLTLLCKEQQGEGAIDLLLGVQDAGDRSSFWLMRAAASSVELTFPELMAIN